MWAWSKSAYMFEMYAVAVHNSNKDVLTVSHSETASSHASSSLWLSPNLKNYNQYTIPSLEFVGIQVNHSIYCVHILYTQLMKPGSGQNVPWPIFFSGRFGSLIICKPIMNALSSIYTETNPDMIVAKTITSSITFTTSGKPSVQLTFQVWYHSFIIKLSQFLLSFHKYL